MGWGKCQNLNILNFYGGLYHNQGYCSVMPIPQSSVMLSDIGAIIFQVGLDEVR